VRAERGYWGDTCYLRLPAAERARLRPGVRYRLVPVQPAGLETWTFAGEIPTLSSDSPGAPRWHGPESPRAHDAHPQPRL
jgi:hypothetical protein